MSGSAEQPERLAEILRQLIALSDPMRTNLPESAHDNDRRTESFNAQCVGETDESGAFGQKEVRQG